MIYSFESEDAKKYGVNAAILLNNFRFWIIKNKANNTNFIDGRTWTYNSRRAFSEMYPFLSENQIKYALKKLIDNGVLITGNYNKKAYDKTNWYAFKDEQTQLPQNQETESKSENSPTHWGKFTDPLVKIHQPIGENSPTNTRLYNRTDYKPDNPPCSPPTQKGKKKKKKKKKNSVKDRSTQTEESPNIGWHC